MEKILNTSDSLSDNTSNKPVKMSIYFTLLIAICAGFAFGMEIGVISGALDLIRAEFQLSIHMEGWVVGILMFGALCGILSASRIAKAVGRRRALLICSITYIISTLLMAFSPGITMLIIGRYILGFSIGILTFAAPLYISEISSQQFRGRGISTFQCAISTGVFVAFISNWALNYLHSWRGMFAVLLVPGIALFIATLVVPRSPRWLVAQGREQEALDVLKKIRASYQIAEQEVAAIADTQKIKNKHLGFQLFKSNKYFRKTVFLGISLQVIQQLTGINIVMIFAPKIFALSGFTTSSQQLFATMIVGAFSAATTVVSIFIIDKLGRKPMLYGGFIIISLGLALLSYGLHSLSGIASLIGIVIFIIGYGLSAGPIVWTMCAEIQPLQGREFGISCSTFANWTLNFIVGTYYLVISQYLGDLNIFIGLVVLNILFLGFFYLCVPETKNVPLETIEHNLMSGIRLRDLGKID